MEMEMEMEMYQGEAGMNNIKVKDVMVKEVLTAEKEESLLSIVERLHKHRMGAIVIVNREKSPIGIVTERDIIRAILAYRSGMTEKQAQDIMSAPLLTVEPDESIEPVASLMTLNRVRRIPVVKGGELQGIVSYRDLTNALRKSFNLLAEETEKLTDRVNRDSLTGLYNKRYIAEQLDYHMELSKRSGNPMAVIMMDIDYFKKINDIYGHVCGDHVLKEVAEILSEKSRSINIVGRYGGEEFIILGPIGSEKSSVYLAERLRVLVEKRKFSCDGKNFNITISAGVAVWNPEIKSADALVKMADNALYTAKRSGRNQVRSACEE